MDNSGINDQGLGFSDSGSTFNAIPSSGLHLLTDIVEDTSKTVMTPTGETMTSTHRGSLKLDTLPPEARKAYLDAKAKDRLHRGERARQRRQDVSAWRRGFRLEEGPWSTRQAY